MGLQLNSRDRALFFVYLAIAAAAFVATQSTLIVALVNEPSWSHAMHQVVGSAPATFVTIDLGVVAAVGLVFMAVEARRIGMRHVWVFIALTFIVAISVALPLFLAARQVRLAKVA